MKRFIVIFSFVLCMLSATVQAEVTFEDLDLPDAESHWNGSDGSGGFTSEDANPNDTRFYTNYNAAWGSWDGFAYANKTDTDASGVAGQYNAIPGHGASGSTLYAIGYRGFGNPPKLEFVTGGARKVAGAYVVNNNYAYYSMRDGDQFAKQFGVTDWFRWTVTGKDGGGNVTGTVDFYLGVGTELVDEWTWVDLSGLGNNVLTLEFEASSSDVGDWGMNTPTYFCLDNLNAAPPQVGEIGFEDLRLLPQTHWKGTSGTSHFVSGNVVLNNNYNAAWDSWDGFAFSNETDTSTTGVEGQFTAVPGEGCRESANYGVGYYSAWAGSPPTVTLPKPHKVSGVYVVNDNYAYDSMQNGDQFAKKFTDQDWFKLTITGKDANGAQTGTVDFLLADGTDLVDRWTWVDLSSLGEVKRLEFTLSSSDTGNWGMNTPAYFCLDHLTFYYDANDNGIPDDQEAGTEDSNNDGTVDTKKVKSATDGTKTVGVNVAGDAKVTGIRSIRAVDPDTISDNTDRPNDLPGGLIDFELNVAAAGDAVTVRVELSFAAPQNATWFKYSEENGWEDYSNHVTWDADRQGLTIELQDGGHGDADGKANGVIRDPGGVGVAPAAGGGGGGAPVGGGGGGGAAGGGGTTGGASGGGSGGGGGGGCFIRTLI